MYMMGIWRSNNNIQKLKHIVDLTLKGKKDIDEHLSTLFSLTLSLKPQMIIELGTRTARSTYAFLLAADLCNCKVISVDINSPKPSFRFKRRWKKLWSFYKKDVILFLEEDFPELIKNQGKKEGKEQGNIFYIDDWHCGDHVIKEWNLIKDFVDPKDIIILHDTMYGWSHPHYHSVENCPDPQWDNGGPYKMISLLDPAIWEYVTIPRCNGLTLIRRKSNYIHAGVTPLTYKDIFLRLNSELLSLVNNKKVVLVGPAPYLQGKGMGKLIDSYDIVVRPNNFIIPEKLQNDYGSRTDIMFHNYGTSSMLELREQIDDFPEEYKALKMLCCSAIKSMHSEKDYLSWPDDYESAVLENMKSVNKHNLPCYWIGVRDYKKLYKAVKAELNTGLASLMILMHYPVSRLFLLGFDFYKGIGRKRTNLEDVYCANFVSEQTKKRCFSNKNFRAHGEKAGLRQKKYFKTIMNKPPLVVDEYIRHLFK